MAEPLPWRHRGSRAVERLVEYAPSTGGLALWIRHRDLDADEDDGDSAATDGTTIVYGAAFDALPLAEQVGLVAHQVLHVALRHAQRYSALQQRLGDADLQLYNACADAIVCSALAPLGWLALPPGAVGLDRLLAEALGVQAAPEAALLAWDVESLYQAIDDRRPNAGPGRPREDGPRARRVRALAAKGRPDLRPGAGPRQAPEAEAEQAREWRERLLRAHAADGAFSMLRVLLADLPRVHTPWEQVLRTRLARALAREPALSWSRPARSYLANQGRAGRGRRMPFEPGRTASKAVPRLAVMVDVSGSIDETLLGRFARELDAITRRHGAGLVLVIGDDRVRAVHHCEPGRSRLGELRFEGAGGTDFTPLLEEADRHAPDLGVVLTDLEGPADFRPRWPVIWALPPSHAGAVPPFGRTLVLR